MHLFNNVDCCCLKTAERAHQAHTSESEEGVTPSYGIQLPVKEAWESQGLLSLALGRFVGLVVILVASMCRELPAGGELVGG